MLFVTRRPPISTPFPTRRSSDLDRDVSNRPGGERASRGEHAEPGFLRAVVSVSVLGIELPRLDALRARRPKRLDRKSTRLNSSHGSISYAVFCLKKKKITLRLCS